MKEIIINGVNTGYFAHKDGYITGKRGNILKPYLCGKDKAKYPCVDLSGFVKSAYIHILVWVAFNGEVPEGLEINHKDGNKLNSCLDNLEIITHSENCLHSFRLKLQNNQGSNHPRSIINEEIASEIRCKLTNGEKHKDIASYYGISVYVVKDISRNKTWKS